MGQVGNLPHLPVNSDNSIAAVVLVPSDVQSDDDHRKHQWIVLDYG
jgi:hypothetical protein